MDDLIYKIGINIEILYLKASWWIYELMGAELGLLWEIEREINRLERMKNL